jgi:protein MAK11
MRRAREGEKMRREEEREEEHALVRMEGVERITVELLRDGVLVLAGVLPSFFRCFAPGSSTVVGSEAAGFHARAGLDAGSTQDLLDRPARAGHDKILKFTCDGQTEEEEDSAYNKITSTILVEMPDTTGKRKREDATVRPNKSAMKKTAIKPAAAQQKKATVLPSKNKTANKTKASAKAKATKPQSVNTDDALSIQIVTGSYERVLHGFTASIPRNALTSSKDDAESDKPNTTFSDTFLFAAHAASVRCLAISPPTESDKRYLATGGSDERVNVYTISTAPPVSNASRKLPSMAQTSISENPSNKSLGSLLHHDRAITRLHFPAKGKLFSSAEDNTIAISRTRDWTALSSIKAPLPKVQGRPSGDTAAPGEIPMGVNDFAIHPSQKLMLSVGRGEKSMRLWNLMTGKKAGVLTFEREVLGQVGEGKFSSGEGRRILFDEAGENFVVGFERGAVMFGIEDSRPKAVIKTTPWTKFHQMHFVPSLEGKSVLAVSTEDGRVLFFDVAKAASEPAPESAKSLPVCECIAQLGGAAAGISGRTKDFEIIQIANTSDFIIVTASSDGAVRLWKLAAGEIAATEGSTQPTQVGSLVGGLETNNRITCLGAFAMDGSHGNTKVDEDDNVSDAGEASGGEE